MVALRRRRLSVTIPAFALAGIAAEARAHDWPQQGLDGSRARTSNEVSGTTFRPAWETPVAGAPIVATPAVADGYIVVAGTGGEVVALRPADGNRVWATRAAGPVGASPAIERGRVYVPTLEGNLQAFRIADGRALWTRTLGGQNYTSPAILGESLIVAAGFPEQKVLSISTVNGSVRWETRAGALADLTASSPAIVGNQVLIGMNGGRYQAFGAESGNTAWTVDTVGKVGLSSPLVVGNVAYMLPGGAKVALYAADVTSGKLLSGWPVAVSDPNAPTGTVLGSRRAVSSAALAGSLVVFVARFEYDLRADKEAAAGLHSLREYLVAVDPRSASVAWQREIGHREVGSMNQIPELGMSPTPASFASAGGSMIAVTSSIAPTVRVFDHGGVETWAGTLGAATRSSPVFANGLLLAATDAGVVHAFSSLSNRAPAVAERGFSPDNGETAEGPAPVLRWEAAADAEGHAVRYDVRIDTDGELLENWMFELATRDGSAEVAVPRGTLTPGSSYVYAVRSRDPAGALSGWSKPRSFTVAVTPSIKVAGVSYDTLDQAIAAAPGGGTVSIGSGNVRIPRPLQVPAGVTLEGAGPRATVLTAVGTNAVIQVSSAGRTGVTEIKGMTVTGGDVGVQVIDGNQVVLRNLIVRDNAKAGIQVEPDAAAEAINVTLVQNGAGALAHGTLAIRNSIVMANQTGLKAEAGAKLTSRYNNIAVNAGANLEGVEPGVGDMSAPIAFAAIEKKDFHILTTQISTDRGDPADDFSAEPAPNGSRINLGAFGGTGEAELSSTDPQLSVSGRSGAPAPISAAAGQVPGAVGGSPKSGEGCSVGGSGGSGSFGSLLALLGIVGIAGARRRPRRAGRTAVVLGTAVVLALALGTTRPAAAAVEFTMGRSGSGTAALSRNVSATWSGETADDSLLVAVLAFSPTLATPSSVPSDWVLATSKAGTAQKMYVYYIKKADQREGTETFTFNTNAYATLQLFEFKGGIDEYVPLDATSSSSGTSATGSAGTLSTSYDTELVVAAFTNNWDEDWQTPSGWSEGGERSQSAVLAKNRTAVFFKQTSDAGSITPTAAMAQSRTWVGAAVSFHLPLKIWDSSSDTRGGRKQNWANADGSSASAAPKLNEVVIFEGNKADCRLAADESVDQVVVRSSYTGTVTIRRGDLNVTRSVSIAGGTLDIETDVGGKLTVSGGTLSLDDGSGSDDSTFGGQATITGGTMRLNAATAVFHGGLTVAGGTLDMSSTTGKLKIKPGTTLAMTSGTLQTSTGALTGPEVTVNGTGTFAFSITGGTVSINGLKLVGTDNTAGLNIGNGATISRLDNIHFANVPSSNPASLSYQLTITKNVLNLSTKGNKFDFNPATFTRMRTVRLVGNGIADGATLAYFQNKSATDNGAAAGGAYDADDDANSDGSADHPTTDGALIFWPRSVQNDTAGAIVGFPSAAFDWNTFTFYNVYASYSGVAANTDRIYVRSVDGEARYSYDFNTATYGTLVGAPRWDTLNESGTVDIDGDGNRTDTSVHVLYVATSNGYIFKLIDTMSALQLPSSGSVWSTPFRDATKVTAITSPLSNDTTNLYFGGRDATTPSSQVRIFSVQISAGGEKTLRTYNPGTTLTAITQTPVRAVFGGDTYLYVASTDRIFRYNVTDNLASGSYATTAAVNGALGLLSTSLWAADSGGKLYQLYADPAAGSGSFTTLASYPVTLSSGALSVPYTDFATRKVFVGDASGNLYKVDAATGAVASGWPITTGGAAISTAPLYIGGYLIAGDTQGHVFYVNDATATLTYMVTFSGAVSSIAYNSSAQNIMIGTSAGGLYYLPKQM